MLVLRPDQDLINKPMMRERREEADMDRLAALSRESAIPRADALRLCNAIRQRHFTRWYFPAAWRCAICVIMAKDGIPARIVTDHPGYCGCSTVNRRYLMEKSRALLSA